MEEFKELFAISKAIVVENKIAIAIFIISLLLIEWLDFLKNKEED